MLTPPLLTEKELRDLEEWRPIEKPSKFQCAWMQIAKNKILKLQKQKPEKPVCFCSVPDRVEYRKTFYPFLDEYLKSIAKPIEPTA